MFVFYFSIFFLNVKTINYDSKNAAIFLLKKLDSHRNFMQICLSKFIEYANVTYMKYDRTYIKVHFKLHYIYNKIC